MPVGEIVSCLVRCRIAMTRRRRPHVSRARPDGWLRRPLARTQDGCCLDVGSRFMNVLHVCFLGLGTRRSSSVKQSFQQTNNLSCRQIPDLPIVHLQIFA